LLNPGNSEKERGRIKYCIFLYIAGESRYILKGVFYSSPAKGRNGRAVFAPGHILLYEKAMKINGKIIFKKC
jgi:hypothetical protein